MVGWKLGWLLLRKEKNRFVIAVAGIAFSTMLIFIQMGFENALYDGCMAPHKALNANLVMINPQFESFLSPKSFSRARLYQCLGFAEVESVESLHLEKGMFKNPQTRLSRNILVFGCDPLGHPFHLPGVEDGLNSLQLLNHVLFDNSSRPEYGRWKILLDQSSKVATEVNNKRIVVTGLFEMGASFAADGNILTSDSTFLRLFPQHLPDAIEVGLIRLSPGTSPAKVQQLMRSTLPSAGVELLTIEEFAEREHHYWATGSGIGFIFGLGVVVGFIVGVVTVYQILHSDVCDHLSEYATLKAMGYSDATLLAVVLQQALIIAVCGYIPGAVLSVALYSITRAVTVLPLSMNEGRLVLVFFLTLFMCVASAFIAMKKLRDADPADIF